MITIKIVFCFSYNVTLKRILYNKNVNTKSCWNFEFKFNFSLSFLISDSKLVENDDPENAKHEFAFDNPAFKGKYNKRISWERFAKWAFKSVHLLVNCSSDSQTFKMQNYRLLCCGTICQKYNNTPNKNKYSTKDFNACCWNEKN